VAADLKEAARWLRKAAEEGHADVQNNLGWMYAKGEGVPKDYVQAYKWFNLAAPPMEMIRQGTTSASSSEI
jgi:hypothetical protein